MRRAIPLPLVAVVILFFRPVSAQTEPAYSQLSTGTNSWKEFSPSDGGFQILFPAQPSEAIVMVRVGGKALSTREYVVRASTVFQVLYFVIPPDFGRSPGSLSDGFGKALIDSTKGMLVSDRGVSLDNHPGRMLEVTTDKGMVLRTILLATDSRVYRLTVAMPPETEPQKREQAGLAATKFLESFKFSPIVEFPENDNYLVTEEGDVDRYLKKKGISFSEESNADVIRGRAVTLPPPRYPDHSGYPMPSGNVKVKILINEDGKVVAAQIVKGRPLFRESALSAARKAHFTPTLKDGKPTKVLGWITYNFVGYPHP